MTETEGPFDTVEASLIDSVVKADMKEFAADITEIAIDSILDDDLLSAIPVVSTVAKLGRATVAIRDQLFLRKVLSFLREFADVPPERRERFAKELENDAGTRAKAGTSLVLLLDRLDDLSKPEIIGRLYRAKLNQEISFGELRRFCMIVDRAFLPDIVALSKIGPNDRVDEVAAPYLQALGLVTECGENLGTIDGIGAETWFEVNDVGQKFLAAAFPAQDS